MSFPSEDCILGSNQFLIELSHRLNLWHYRGAEHVRTLGSTSFLAISGDKNGGLLLATKLPHPEATALLKSTSAHPDLFVFRKGVPVKLDVSGIPDAGHRRSVREVLAKKLGAMNCPVADAGKVEVAAAVDGPKSKTLSVPLWRTYQVQQYLTKLKIVYQGQTLWETLSDNFTDRIPFMDEEEIGPFLREASLSPRYKFYDEVTLPEFLQRPSGATCPGGSLALGTSWATSLASGNATAGTSTAPGFVRIAASPPLRLKPDMQDVFQGHTDEIMCLAFSLDGKLLASQSRDKTIKLWDISSGGNTATLHVNHGLSARHRDQSAWSLRFSPDGKTLVSASFDSPSAKRRSTGGTWLGASRSPPWKCPPGARALSARMPRPWPSGAPSMSGCWTCRVARSP